MEKSKQLNVPISLHEEDPSFIKNNGVNHGAVSEQLGIYSGIIVGFLGLLVMLETIYEWAVKGTPNGYATIVVLLCFMFAMLFVIVGIIGEYIAILFTELKDRPIYIVHDTKGFPEKES